MKKLAIMFLFCSLPAIAQNGRWDLQATTVQAQGGNLLPVYAIPGASVSFYSCTSDIASSCVTPAVTYNGAGTACPSTAQVNPQGSLACTAQADTAGNFGAWFANGTYAYVLTTSGRSYGPYLFSVGSGSSGGGIQSINGSIGPAITVAGGTGISVTTVGSTITISTTTPFTINSFTGCGGSLELGQTITNPTCAATYSATPSSASITNTDSIDSPLTLTTPFTSGTIVGSFVHTATATTTVTLTAVGSSTQTATQTYTWKPAIFAGLGTAGATSSVTASGTTAVLSTGTVLPRAQLGAETVGETFGPFAPSAQVIYLLLTGGSHTFTDVCSGFPLPFNAPISVSFVNQYGVTVSEFLYQTTNVLTGSCFEPRIAS